MSVCCFSVMKKGRNLDAEQLRPGHSIGPPGKAFLNICVPLPLTLFRPSLACRKKKISSHLQHASLSLVRFQEYTIIHPARGAEEDTWAGEAATSKNTVWALSFHSCPFWDGENSLLLPHFTQGQSQDVGSLLFYTDAFAVFLVLL